MYIFSPICPWSLPSVSVFRSIGICYWEAMMQSALEKDRNSWQATFTSGIFWIHQALSVLLLIFLSFFWKIPPLFSFLIFIIFQSTLLKFSCLNSLPSALFLHKLIRLFLHLFSLDFAFLCVNINWDQS